MTIEGTKNLKWTVIGGGNGGQSAAGHLGLLGFPVKLYDIIPETVMAINNQGGIYVDGEVEGFGKVDHATINIKDAVSGSDIIMIVAPALAHRTIAKNLVPALEDGQIIFVHPGATLGALEFRRVFEEENLQKDVIVSEAMSLVYACRSPEPGRASIKGIKKQLMVAAHPANKTDYVVNKLNQAFPQIYAGKNVLETSLSNLNAIVHPAPSILNTSLIESDHTWRYYVDGITPTIGEFVQELDKERLEIANAFGFKLPTILEMYNLLYEARGETLTDAVRSTKAYTEIMGQKRMDTRYLLEDIPMGLVPMISLANVAGVKSEVMETVCKLGEFVLKKDLIKSGRTLESLQLHLMNHEELIEYVNTGTKPCLAYA